MWKKTGSAGRLKRVMLTLLKVLFFPFYLVMRCVEEISGEGRWYRQPAQFWQFAEAVVDVLREARRKTTA